VKAGAGEPAKDTNPEGGAAYKFIYNATCMKEVRTSLLEVVNGDKTGVVRPPADPPAKSTATAIYSDSLEKSYLFFKTQWTGLLPEGYEADVSWRTAGFVDLDEDTCKGRNYTASFANGSASLRSRASA
jgi:hypothetical protein